MANRPPKFHNLIGVPDTTLRIEHDDRADAQRFTVWHMIPDLQAGDVVRWVPTSLYGHRLLKDAAPLYRVVVNIEAGRFSAGWRAEFGRLEEDVTIAGETYKAPNQGFLVPIETRPHIGGHNPDPKKKPYPPI